MSGFRQVISWKIESTRFSSMFGASDEPLPRYLHWKSDDYAIE